MLAIGEDEVICDLAQTYHILNYKELSPSLVAVLCCGLDDNSRIKRKMAKSSLTLQDALMALLVDGVHTLIWQRTKDGSKGRNRPESIFKKLMHIDEKPKDELMKFTSEASFEQWYRSKRDKNG